MSLGKRHQIVRAGHRALSIQHFSENGRGEQPCKCRKVNGRLCRRRTSQHAPRSGRDGKNMTRLDQICGLAGGIDRHLNRSRPIRRRDAGIDARGGLYR